MRCEGCEEFRAKYHEAAQALVAAGKKQGLEIELYKIARLEAGERNDVLVARLLAIQKGMAEAGYPEAANMMNAIWEKP